VILPRQTYSGEDGQGRKVLAVGFEPAVPVSPRPRAGKA